VITDINTETNYELSHELMKKLSSKEDTSELLAVIKMRKDATSEIKLSKNPLLAIFDRPSNKGNLGTLIRSCDSLGVEGLIITGHGVDLYDPDVISSSMGSFFKVPVLRASGNEFVDTYIGSLRQEFPNLQLIGSTAHSEKAIFDLDLTGPIVFMIGNETDGLCFHYKEISDIMTTIPMAENSSASSFNVACASTVMFYEAIRQRNSIKN
jgi:23S rRNA (uridine2479-2'-O)-methyltransferase